MFTLIAIALGIARLLLAPFLLLLALVVVILLTVYGGIMWIFTGSARVWFSWPTVKPRRRWF